jgi:hypothetical protein
MSSVGSVTTPYHRPVPGEASSREEVVSTVQHGPLQILSRSMLDLHHRMTGLEREPSPEPSLSPPLLSLVVTTSVVAPVSDSIINECPDVTVPLDYVRHTSTRADVFGQRQ